MLLPLRIVEHSQGAYQHVVGTFQLHGRGGEERRDRVGEGGVEWDSL